MKHYDLELGTLKANTVCWMSEISGDALDADEIPEYVEKKRRKRDREDLATAQEDARTTLQEGAKRRNPVNKRTKQWNITPSEREMFQRVLSDQNNVEMAAATLQDRFFPSDKKGGRWTKLFYRLLDSLQGPDGERMRAVEMDLFHNKYKPDGWNGSKVENRLADKKIAAAIRSSMAQYEKNPKATGFKGHIFKFK